MWLKPIPTAGAEHVPQRHVDTVTHDSITSLHYPPTPQKMTAPTYQLKYGNLVPFHLHIKMTTKTSILHLPALMKESKTVYHVSLYIFI
jgi:hypothetical protein